MNPILMVLAKKELRALLPIWVAAAFPLAAEPLLRGTGIYRILPLSMLAYVVGALALGAHVVGHEYSYRTLPTLLVQPCRRSTLLAAKSAVLALMLLALGMIAGPVFWPALTSQDAPFSPYIIFLLPLAGGLCVAPWLTMQFRNQLAGTIFTAAIPGTTYVTVLLAGFLFYGIEGRAADLLALRVWTPAMIVFAIGGGLLSARSFLRLEAMEGGGEELTLPRWLLVEDRRPVRPPLWALVKKELRLQQMTFALAAIFTSVWLAVTVVRWINPSFVKDFPLGAVALLYFALLPLLMGALASAQERQFGMLETQSMLPVSFVQQWMVKAGVVLTLALVLGVLLPWSVFSTPQLSRVSVWPITASALLLSSWSLYLSSCSRSGIIALALTLPATAAVALVVRTVDAIVGIAFRGPAPGLGLHLPPNAGNVVATAVVAALVSLLLYFAAANHRSIERRFDRLALQSLGLIAAIAAADFAAFLFLS